MQEVSCTDGQYYIESVEQCVNSCLEYSLNQYDNNRTCLSGCPHMYQNQSYICVKVWDENTETHDCDLYVNMTDNSESTQNLITFRTEYECINIPQDQELQVRTYFLTDLYDPLIQYIKKQLEDYGDYFSEEQKEELQKEIEEVYEQIQSSINSSKFEGQLPKIYFSQDLCQLLENKVCKEIDPQQVESREGIYNQSQWQYDEEFSQFWVNQQWQYISTNQPLQNNSQNNQTNQTQPNITTNQTYTCQVNISYNYAQDVQTQQRNYKTHYQCIDITTQNEGKVKEILLKELWGVQDEDYQDYQQMNLTAKGQLPRIYFNKELCNYLENTQCNELPKKQYAYLEFSFYQNQYLLQEYEGDVTEEQNWIYVSPNYSPSSSNSSSNSSSTDKKPETDGGSQSNNNQLSAGEIAGIAVGCVALVAIIIVSIVCCQKQNKQKNTNKQNVDVQLQPQSFNNNYSIQQQQMMSQNMIYQMPQQNIQDTMVLQQQPQQLALQPIPIPQQGAVNTNNLQNNNFNAPVQYPQQY